MAIWFVIVPEGQKRPDSIPNISADIFSNSFIDGSSLKTSSPTFAVIITCSMTGVGFVTVSDLKSMIIILISCNINRQSVKPKLLFNPIQTLFCRRLVLPYRSVIVLRISGHYLHFITDQLPVNPLYNINTTNHE